MTGGAAFSRDRRYRYRLWRRWDRSRPAIAFCMLNPSTADARRDDPTIRRCIGFARDWGYGGIEVVNIFALRATDPRALRSAHDPVGPRNDAFMLRAARRSPVVIAWGVHGALRDRGATALRLFGPRTRVLALGRTRSGAPRHPLYLRRDVEAVEYAPA
jgi:hypothetical protein